MRTLKYALLGLIDREPITGYDIVKEFESRVMANFWYAKHSQVYPELKKLTDEGFVEYKVILQGEKMEKKLYSITPAGHEEFVKWMKKDEPIGVTPKDIFRYAEAAHSASKHLLTFLLLRFKLLDSLIESFYLVHYVKNYMWQVWFVVVITNNNLIVLIDSQFRFYIIRKCVILKTE